MTSAPVRRAVVSVIASCYNEEAIIETFYSRLRAALDGMRDVDWWIVIVDDGSTDRTLELLNRLAANDPRLLVYSLSRNFGHQAALSAGLDVAGGDAVVMMDSDLQHPPEVVPLMIDRWRAGFDVVSAVRLATGDATAMKRWSASAFYKIINALSDTPVVPGAADFCLLSSRAHAALASMPERHRFLRGMVSWIGFPRALVPFEAPARAGGESKYTPLKMIGLALDALFSFTATPMKLASRIGVMLVLPAIAYFAYIVARYIVVGDLVRGWGSLISVLLIIGGLQLVFIGLIGEYVARAFEEVKRRPLYIFKQRPSDVGGAISSPAIEETRATR